LVRVDTRQHGLADMGISPLAQLQIRDDAVARSNDVSVFEVELRLGELGADLGNKCMLGADPCVVGFLCLPDELRRPGDCRDTGLVLLLGIEPLSLGGRFLFVDR
jgi:hypothetical protein